MRGEGVRVAGVVALLILAGCSAPVGPVGSGATTDTPTLTPAELPPAPPPPGLSMDDIVDATALATAHDDALADQSFTISTSYRLTDENGTVTSLNRTRRIAANRTVYAATQRATWTNRSPVRSVSRRIDLYHTGEQTFYRAVDETVSYDRVFDRRGLTDPTTVGRLRELYIAGDGWQVTRRSDEDRVDYVLVTESVSRGALEPPTFATAPRDPRLTVRLTADGRLVGWQLTYAVTYGHGEAETEGRVVRTTNVSAVGTTQVREPPWLDDARNATADG